MDSYIFIHHKRDGTTTVERRYVNGEAGAPPKRGRRANPGSGGVYMRSKSMAVSVDQLAKAQKLDVELGVNSDYEVRGPIAYKTFPDAAALRAWRQAHRWVCHDPGYRDQVPGDFTPKDHPVGMPGPRRIDL